MDRKHAIIENLRILRLLELKNKQPFKAKAYDNVIKQINEIPFAIREFADLEKASVKGIGKSIA